MVNKRTSKASGGRGFAHGTSRRQFLGAAGLGAGAALSGTLWSHRSLAEVLFPPGTGGFRGSVFAGGGSAAGSVHRAEVDLFDCEVEGKLPPDLDGAFYRVGPDAQYPKDPKYNGDIYFDGEGHASVFRISNGHVDYRSRYVRNERWRAQHQARRSLFGMYRNPLTDDPSVLGLSRGTANTQLFLHHQRLLVLKEDSPPAVLDPHTLETLDDYYTFGGRLKSLTHTAHPKIDPVSGELVAFGYQATGVASNDVYVYSADRNGAINWEAWIKVPYSGLLHDFAVTQKHVVFFMVPLVTHMDKIHALGLHYVWDGTLPSYVGVLRRGGDGSDVRWFQAPQLFCDHTMGSWCDGDKVYVDMDGQEGNRYPFFPSLQGPTPPAQGHIHRFTIDLRSRSPACEHAMLFPEAAGGLARQDDRYHTVPYRYGFLNGFGVDGSHWIMVDHMTGTTKNFALPGYSLSEMCFVPRRKGAPEGDGYLVGVGDSSKENGRSDMVLFDTQDPSSPVARVKMPFKVVTQIHGFWASADQLPPQTPDGDAILTSIPRVVLAGAGSPVSLAKEKFPASWKRPAYNMQSGEIVGPFACGAATHRV